MMGVLIGEEIVTVVGMEVGTVAGCGVGVFAGKGLKIGSASASCSGVNIHSG